MFLKIEVIYDIDQQQWLEFNLFLGMFRSYTYGSGLVLISLQHIESGFWS